MAPAARRVARAGAAQLGPRRPRSTRCSRACGGRTTRRGAVDPGRYDFARVPPSASEHDGEDQDDADADNDKPRARWCKKCARPKPARAHHCRHCGCCVPKMDHHCPWTGNCVGLQTFPALCALPGLRQTCHCGSWPGSWARRLAGLWRCATCRPIWARRRPRSCT